MEGDGTRPCSVSFISATSHRDVLLLLALFAVIVLEASLQKNLVDEDVGVCGGDGGTVGKCLPRAHIVWMRATARAL